MPTGLFTLFVLIVRISDTSALIIEGKTLIEEKGANVSTASEVLRGVSVINCVGKCMLGNCNMVGYHKPTKTCFLSKDMSYEIIQVSDPSYRVVNLQGRFVSQWVESVLDFSSEYSTTSYAAGTIVGEPDVYPAYRSDGNAWGPATWNSSEFIEVAFSNTVQVTSVEIYETMSGGVVTGIKCFQDGTFHSLYVGVANVLEVARIFSPILAAPCVSNRFRIEVFPIAVSGLYMEIDAIPLNGTLV